MLASAEGSSAQDPHSRARPHLGSNACLGRVQCECSAVPLRSPPGVPAGSCALKAATPSHGSWLVCPTAPRPGVSRGCPRVRHRPLRRRPAVRPDAALCSATCCSWTHLAGQHVCGARLPAVLRPGRCLRPRPAGEGVAGLRRPRPPEEDPVSRHSLPAPPLSRKYCLPRGRGRGPCCERAPNPRTQQRHLRALECRLWPPGVAAHPLSPQQTS